MEEIPKYHWLKKRPIIHRGMFNNELGIIENSLEAINLAVKANYPIEIDVRVIKDGTVILFHDNNLKRLTGIDKYYYKLTLKELNTIKYKNSKCGIATLKQVLEIVNGKVPLLIELKYYGDFWIMNKLAKETYKTLKDYKGEYAIQSFYPPMEKIYRKLDNKHFIGLIAPIQLAVKKRLYNNFILNLSLKFYNYDFISYNIKHLPNKIIESNKLPKIFWVIDNKGKKDLALKNNGNFIWSNTISQDDKFRTK